MCQLNDVLAQVGLHNFESIVLQDVVETHLLRDHRFALDDGMSIVASCDVPHVTVRLIDICGEVDIAAMGFDIVCELAQVVVQVRYRVVLDSFTARPLRFPIQRVSGGREPTLMEAVIYDLVRDLQWHVCQSLARSLAELFRLDRHAHVLTMCRSCRPRLRRCGPLGCPSRCV